VVLQLRFVLGGYRRDDVGAKCQKREYVTLRLHVVLQLRFVMGGYRRDDV